MQKQPIAEFMETNILGVMTPFSDIVNDVRGRKSVTEKLCCIVGIKEVTQLSILAVPFALPQVCCIKNILLGLTKDCILSSYSSPR